MAKNQQQTIPLTLSPALKKTGIVKDFLVSKSKATTNIIVDLNGKYDNKKVVSTVNLKNWKKTHIALTDALVTKDVTKEHRVHKLLSTLGPKLYCPMTR